MRTPESERRQRVFVVPESSARWLYASATFHTEAAVLERALLLFETEGRLVDRQIAERSPSMTQLVACCLVRRGDDLLCVRRSRKSERDCLRLAYTLLFGGHADEQDGCSLSGLEMCTRRELAEELGLGLPDEHKFSLLGIAADPDTESGAQHLGIVFETEVRADAIQISSRHDFAEFVGAGRSSTLGFTSIEEVFHIYDQLDPWSSLVVSNHLAAAAGRAKPCHQMMLAFG